MRNDHDRLVRAEERLRALRELLDQRSAMSEVAIAQATAALDRRLDGMNEFRAALSEAQGTYATQEALDVKVNEANRRVDALRDEWLRGHSELTDRVNDLSTEVAASTGTSAGTMRIFLVAAVGISLLSLIGGLVDLITR